jgi:hypothetical protein
MEDSFKFRAALRTVDELNERVNNREKYMPETVEASVEELKHRGVSFSDEELKVITEDMQARRDQGNSKPSSRGIFNPADKVLQVKDPDAPAFYPKGAIYGFSILFSVLFGSIMLAINIHQTKKTYRAIWVVLYGLIFTLAEVIVFAGIRQGSAGSLAFIGGLIGSYPLNYFFWPRYLGNTTLYRRRPVWIPLVIGLVIWIPIIYLIIIGGN